MGCYLLRKQLCFPTRSSGTAMICSHCKMMIICYSQPTRGVVTGFWWDVPTAPTSIMPEMQARKFVLLIHLVSLSSLLRQLLTLKHPEGSLGDLIPATGSFTRWHFSSPLVELSLTLTTPSERTDTIFNSFILCICFSDIFEQQSPFLSHFLLNKEAFQEFWSTLCLSCVGVTLPVTMSVLHGVLFPSARSWPLHTWP